MAALRAMIAQGPVRVHAAQCGADGTRIKILQINNLLMRLWTTRRWLHLKDVRRARVARHSSPPLGTFVPRELSKHARQRIELSKVFASAASIWEISIKSSLGKLEADPDEVLAGVERAGFTHLPIVGGHAAKVKELPPIHKDPLGRLLVAQARFEPMILLTDGRHVRWIRRPCRSCQSGQQWPPPFPRQFSNHALAASAYRPTWRPVIIHERVGGRQSIPASRSGFQIFAHHDASEFVQQRSRTRHSPSRTGELLRCASKRLYGAPSGD